ncbi:MAG: DUF3015 family protein [Emcibacteraceae bacterium]|nr:DUF3015 family protein [Emcibacteraceae bacterium]
MLKKYIIILSLGIIGITSTAQSQELNAWKHCGIGAMVWGEKETGAIISNVIWDLGTTALTSQVSSPETCEGAPAQTAMFINESYDKLAEETASGKGEHLTAMMDILQCDVSARNKFVTAIRADFSTALAKNDTPITDRTARAEQYFNIVDAHFKTGFKQYCNAI